MAGRKRDKRNTRNLKRRLAYHGLDHPTETKEERAKARGAILRAKNQKKKERQNQNTLKKVVQYNTKNHERNKLNILDRGIQSLKPEKKRALDKLLSKINKGEKIEKNREKLVDFLKSLIPSRDNKGKSVRVLSSGVENRARVKASELTLLEEQYYKNFLKACIRKGAFALYRKAEKRGYPFVVDLYKRGFDINDLYEFTQQGIADVYHSDEKVDYYLANPEKIPRISSEIGQAIVKKYKVR